MADLELLSVVALIRDMPEAGLIRGQVGTIVEVLGPEVFEVEFSDDGGRTNASLTLGSNDLLRLHHEPLHEAA
jgi:hypothetical protein